MYIFLDQDVTGRDVDVSPGNKKTQFLSFMFGIKGSVQGIYPDICP